MSVILLYDKHFPIWHQFSLFWQAYIESDIQKYSPAPGDLAYPEKLIIGVGKHYCKIETVGYLTFWLLHMHKTEFCLLISIKYQADNWGITSWSNTKFLELTS